MPMLTTSDYQAHKKRPLSSKVRMQCEFENRERKYGRKWNRENLDHKTPENVRIMDK